MLRFSWGMSDFDYLDLCVDNSGVAYVSCRDGYASGKPSVMRVTAPGAWDYLGGAGISTSTAVGTSIGIASSTDIYLTYFDESIGKAVAKKYPIVSAVWLSLGHPENTVKAINPVMNTYGGNTCMLYNQETTNYPCVMKYNPSTTVWEILGSAITNGALTSGDIAVYGAEPYVFLAEASTSRYGVVYKYVTAGGWTCLGPSSGISSAAVEAPDIFINSSGDAYIAYTDTSASWGLTVRKYSGSSWDTLGGTGVSPGWALQPEIFVDGDTVYAAYIDNSVGMGAVRVMKYSNSAWTLLPNVDTADNMADFVNIFVRNGSVYVAYKWLYDNGIRLMKFD
jgi:hypothetical protein